MSFAFSRALVVQTRYAFSLEKFEKLQNCIALTNPKKLLKSNLLSVDGCWCFWGLLILVLKNGWGSRK